MGTITNKFRGRWGGEIFTKYSPPLVLLVLVTKAFENINVVVAALRLAVIDLWQDGDDAQLMTFTVVLQHISTGYLDHRQEIATASNEHNGIKDSTSPCAYQQVTILQVLGVRKKDVCKYQNCLCAAYLE